MHGVMVVVVVVIMMVIMMVVIVIMSVFVDMPGMVMNGFHLARTVGTETPDGDCFVPAAAFAHFGASP
jgi:hypothetical protein